MADLHESREGMITTISKEVTDAAAEVVRGLLVERYKDTLIFDPIVVIPRVDDYDQEYLHFHIACNGQFEMLDMKWDLEFRLLVKPGLAELGIESSSVFSFIPKTDWIDENWDEYLEGMLR